MTALGEFVWIALALFVWESLLWIPLRGVSLRLKRGGRRWRVLDPTRLFTTRRSGVVPMLPFPVDAGLAPCQVPPLLVSGGRFYAAADEGHWVAVELSDWGDLKEEGGQLHVAGRRVVLSSVRAAALLGRARRRGASVEEAVRQAWLRALSPVRCGREWRKWRLVSRPLALSGPLLTLGFFVGLPAVYVLRGPVPAVMFAAGLWVVMAWTAGFFWWLGRRVYPDARAALWMDAALALVVPFHAMRAREIASVHATATSHPVGMILSTGDMENPWLGRWVRGVLHPRPEVPEDRDVCAALRGHGASALAGRGMVMESFAVPPPRHSGEEAVGSYCPRCHAVYEPGAAVCSDCRGVPLSRGG